MTLKLSTTAASDAGGSFSTLDFQSFLPSNTFPAPTASTPKMEKKHPIPLLKIIATSHDQKPQKV